MENKRAEQVFRFNHRKGWNDLERFVYFHHNSVILSEAQRTRNLLGHFRQKGRFMGIHLCVRGSKSKASHLAK
jgi:hypothetical protein